jgi:hypothetical protein
MNYISFSWPPLEAALSIFNVSFLVKKVFFGKELRKIRRIDFNADS